MPGAGIITLTVLLALLPLEMWWRRHEKFKRLRPEEQHLQRASHGLGIPLVLGILATLFYGTAAPWDFGAAAAADPSAMAWAAVLLAALLTYCLVRGIAGARQAAGLRDPILAPSAFFKLIAGGAGFAYLSWGNPELASYAGASLWSALLWLALLMLALWCLVIGGIRFLLLTVGGGSPLRRITKHIRQTQIVLRPARRRRWWQFW